MSSSAMSSIDLYKKYLKGPEYARTASSELLIKTAKSVFYDETAPEEIRINSLVILVYKLLESADFNQALSFRRELLCWIHGFRSKIFETSEFLGVRKDPGQLFLSMLTVERHLCILSEELASEDFSFSLFSEFVENDSVLSPSYSKNVGAAFLHEGFCLYRKGLSDGYLKLVDQAYKYFIRIVVHSGAQGKTVPSSSHFGDLNSFMTCMKFLLAGKETLAGERDRSNVMKIDKILGVVSRVETEDYIGRYRLFFEKLT